MKDGAVFGEHNTVYLVTTETPQGLRPHWSETQFINQTIAGCPRPSTRGKETRRAT